MLRTPKRTLHAISATIGLLTPALAHPGHALGSGFATGLAHPITGLDHLGAMVLVGLIAARIGGRAIAVLPLCFVASMILGSVLGMQGAQVGLNEVVIAGSLITFGLVAATGAKPSLALAVSGTAVFALFHGFAHGAEFPPGAGRTAYVAGFVTTTAALHLAGIAIQIASTRMGRSISVSRLLGLGGILLGAAALATGGA